MKSGLENMILNGTDYHKLPCVFCLLSITWIQHRSVVERLLVSQFLVGRSVLIGSPVMVCSSVLLGRMVFSVGYWLLSVVRLPGINWFAWVGRPVLTGSLMLIGGSMLVGSSVLVPRWWLVAGSWLIARC